MSTFLYNHVFTDLTLSLRMSLIILRIGMFRTQTVRGFNSIISLRVFVYNGSCFNY
jgi:hypothetical protein